MRVQFVHVLLMTMLLDDVHVSPTAMGNWNTGNGGSYVTVAVAFMALMLDSNRMSDRSDDWYHWVYVYVSTCDPRDRVVL